jgi:hypothetical protein
MIRKLPRLILIALLGMVPIVAVTGAWQWKTWPAGCQVEAEEQLTEQDERMRFFLQMLHERASRLNTAKNSPSQSNVK